MKYYIKILVGPQSSASSIAGDGFQQQKHKADEVALVSLNLLLHATNGNRASAEAGVEAAEAAGAFPSDAEAGVAEAASSNGGGGDDDGGARSRHHPSVHRQAQHRRMRLRRRPR